MRGYPVVYSALELAWVKKHSALPRREAHAMFRIVFNRKDVSLDHFKHLCTRNGWTTGRTGCFAKGQAPHNKGQKMPYNANSARTQFKPGGLPPNTKYLGHERVSKDGYVEISIAETNPHTGFRRRYVLKHLHLWKQQHGPLPAGHCLKCKDGNRQNCDPSNWELIPRALLPFLNGHRGPNYDKAEPDARPAILMLAKLKRARFQRTKTAVAL